MGVFQFFFCYSYYYFTAIIKDYLHMPAPGDCLQCFDAVGWAAGRAPGLYKTEWWDAGVVVCLEQGADSPG